MRKITTLLTILLIVAIPSMAQQVVAHRGHHGAEGAAENSIAALHAAESAGIEIVEVDVIITQDMQTVVAHGPRHSSNGTSVAIGNTDYATLRTMPLSNGETMPTLSEYLAEVKHLDDITLFVEIKDTGNKTDAHTLFSMIDKQIVDHGLTERIKYISFSKAVCDYATAQGRRALYLGSDIAPRRVAKRGYDGMNYSIKILRLHPGWIRRAHDLGLRVGAWTANNTRDIEWAIRHGVDYITTDNPALVQKLLTKHN